MRSIKLIRIKVFLKDFLIRQLIRMNVFNPSGGSRVLGLLLVGFFFDRENLSEN